MEDETGKGTPIQPDEIDPWDPRYAGKYRERDLWTRSNDYSKGMRDTMDLLAEYLDELNEGDLARVARDLGRRAGGLAWAIRRRRAERTLEAE